MDISVHSTYFPLSVCPNVFGLLNCSTIYIHVQIDNLPLINEGHLVCF